MTRNDIAGKIYVFFTVLTCSAYILAVLLGNIARTELHITELEKKSAADIQALEEKYNSDVKALREDIDRLNQENADQAKQPMPSIFPFCLILSFLGIASSLLAFLIKIRYLCHCKSSFENLY